MAIDPRAAEDAIAPVRKDIEALDEDTMNCCVGVAQALGQLTEALEDVDARMNERKYEQAANLGYGSVSSGFVFLQRVLGEINSLESRKALIVQNLAMKLHCAYEDIAPAVDALMKSMQPREPITLTDAVKHEASMERFKRWSARFAPGADEDQDDDEADDEPDDAEVRATVERLTTGKAHRNHSVGFGREGWRKAEALLQAVKTSPADKQATQIPQETLAKIASEAQRLAVTESQLIQAAITSWIESNPKSAKETSS